MNTIQYNGSIYEDDNLMDLDCYIGDSLVADELAVDTLTAVVRNHSVKCLMIVDGNLAVADDSLAMADTTGVTLDMVGHYGDSVEYFRRGSLFGKFYLESIKRTGKYEYTLNCLSAIGMLLTSDHYGGLYNGETAAEVMADIVGGIISYTLADELASVPIYGLLPKAKRRDNLRDLLFAIGGQIRKDTLGELNIIPMTAGEPYEISADEFYMGGSVTGGNPATCINVTEHSYMQLANDEIVTLYDGESAAEEMITPKGDTVTGVLVNFSDPVYDLTIQNAEILESGVNYAVITGSPAAVLTGKKYTHTERIITRRQETGGTPNVLNSSACTLINLMNAELVADRLMAYYGAAKTIEADIVVTDHKPGDAVTFDDPFGDPTTGFIADMELTVSTILKAKTTLVSGYIPTASGNYYSNLITITETGTFTVPDDCKGKIRVVLIGGGAGGSCGEAGEDGTDGGERAVGNGGAGGAGGTGGSPGKIYIATIAVEAGQTIDVEIGAGGTGAEYGGSPGEGGATIFGDHTTDNGFMPASGYAAFISGDIYATPGDSGVAGGAGLDGLLNDPADPTTVTYNGETWYSGAVGDYEQDDSGAIGTGGGGGGPAVGANGGDGTDGDITTFSDGEVSAEGGDGGDGATPIAAESATIPGSGGMGGHGGGGGGGGGGMANGDYNIFGGDAGSGGSGGTGGDGAPGIVLIYY